MRLVLLGGTGRTGRAVLDLAVARGHEVTAVARSAAALSAGARVRRIEGDPLDPEVLGRASDCCDAIISTLGPRSPSSADSAVYSMSARSIVAAANEAGLQRVIVVSSALLFPNLGALGAVLRLITRHALRAAEEMERTISSSDLEWTVARPGRLTNGDPVDGYRVARGALPERPMPISRADLAKFILRELEEPAYVRAIAGLCA
jgi:putative NADH-flavin reductase